MAFQEMTIRDFLQALASSSPTPGGGSVAALSGALAAALVSMVASLTSGKKGYEAYQELMEDTIENTAFECKRFQDRMDQDAIAFDQVSFALKLPKETEEEKTFRTQKVQQALKNACEVPFDTARAIIPLCEKAVKVYQFGNKNARSDAVCAMELCRAGFRMASENISINLSLIKDKPFIQKMEKEMVDLSVELEKSLKIS